LEAARLRRRGAKTGLAAQIGCHYHCEIACPDRVGQSRRQGAGISSAPGALPFAGSCGKAGGPTIPGRRRSGQRHAVRMRGKLQESAT